jgi:hypothetical protein
MGLHEIARPPKESNMKVGYAALLLTALASACAAPLAPDTKGTIRIELGDLNSACDGAETEVDEDGTAVWTQQHAELCFIHVAWQGVVLEAEQVKAHIPADLEARGVVLQVQDIALRDAEGADIPSAVLHIDTTTLVARAFHDEETLLGTSVSSLEVHMDDMHSLAHAVMPAIEIDYTILTTGPAVPR